MSSRAKVVERLRGAVKSRELVRVSRSPRNADRVYGFPVAVGDKWVLLAETGDGGYFDGLVAVRRRDVVRVKADKTFAARFARTRPEWPPTAPPEIDLESTKGLIESLSVLSPLIAIEQERRYDGMRWIGAVHEAGDGWLWLHEVRPDATWQEKPLGYRLSRITKVCVRDRYQTALASVAGERPPIRAADG